MDTFTPQVIETQFGWAHFSHTDRASGPFEITSTDSYRLYLFTAKRMDVTVGERNVPVTGYAIVHLPPYARATGYGYGCRETMIVSFRTLMFGTVDTTIYLAPAGVIIPSEEQNQLLLPLFRRLADEYKQQPTMATGFVFDSLTRAI